MCHASSPPFSQEMHENGVAFSEGDGDHTQSGGAVSSLPPRRHTPMCNYPDWGDEHESCKIQIATMKGPKLIELCRFLHVDFCSGSARFFKAFVGF